MSKLEFDQTNLSRWPATTSGYVLLEMGRSCGGFGPQDGFQRDEESKENSNSLEILAATIQLPVPGSLQAQTADLPSGVRQNV